MGTAVRPAKTSPGPWDAFADVDVFVDEVLAELAAMTKDGARPMRSGPKPPLAGAALRKAVMAIWCVCFCGMQGELNWSSQHLEGGCYDDRPKTAFATIWAAAIVVTRSTAGGRTR
jgi:hypothetical protein